MEILDVTKTVTREGFDNYYFSIRNFWDKEYCCSIAVFDKIIIKFNCECKHQIWEISRKVKTGKLCRHIKLCKEYLKNKKIIK